MMLTVTDVGKSFLAYTYSYNVRHLQCGSQTREDSCRVAAPAAGQHCPASPCYRAALLLTEAATRRATPGPPGQLGPLPRALAAPQTSAALGAPAAPRAPAAQRAPPAPCHST
jgi:hypothetical protein